MNLEQFYTALAATGYKWEKEKPAFLEDAKPARLRATIEPAPEKEPGTLQTVCPITAVCFHQTGVFYDTTDFEEAAERIELAPESYHSIIEAADKCPNSGPTFEQNPALVEIRTRLKAAAGLPFDEVKE